MPIRNLAKERLAAGELSIGMGVKALRTVEIARIMKTAGFDWLFIDLEHGPISVESAYQICIAALAMDIAPIVRVPHGELTMATRCLDGGALGIVMPHIDTADEARALVDAVRYRPLGHRSIAGGYPQYGFAPVPATQLTQEMNDATLVIPMIETPRAVENADAIAAVPGIDALLMGTNDLCLEMDLPGKLDHERVVAAVQTVVNACKRHGKWPGLGGVYGKDLLGRYIKLGMQLILAGNDLPLLVAAATEQANFVRSC